MLRIYISIILVLLAIPTVLLRAQLRVVSTHRSEAAGLQHQRPQPVQLLQIEPISSDESRTLQRQHAIRNQPPHDRDRGGIFTFSKRNGSTVNFRPPIPTVAPTRRLDREQAVLLGNIVPHGEQGIFSTSNQQFPEETILSNENAENPLVPEEKLLPLEVELAIHGGSSLYSDAIPGSFSTEFGYERMPGTVDTPQIVSDELHYGSDGPNHHSPMRLPEDWDSPQPITHFQDFLGADPIHPRPGYQWFGDEGFQWEQRFVGSGSYELFGIAYEQGGQRQDGVGQQLLVDLDLRLTGTERFHAQFRPVGKKNSGGSFWQFNSPSGYVDNSTAIPDRYWFEGEIYSIFSDLFDDQFTPRDFHFVVGKFPFSLHNNLLMNDDILGVVINKNSIIHAPLSNLNLQVFFGLDDVDNTVTPSPQVYGLHVTGDWHHAFLEATYAFMNDREPTHTATNYLAGSATQFFGPLTLAGRMLFRWDDDNGDGALYVLESNYNRCFPESFSNCTGIDHGVFYLNLFKATSGWTPISGGNFDRLRTAFEVDPIIGISSGRTVEDTIGASAGVQLFRHNEDESLIPEIAWEEPTGTAVWGMGLRYLRKLNARTFVELRGIRTWSDDALYQREGLFASTFLIL